MKIESIVKELEKLVKELDKRLYSNDLIQLTKQLNEVIKNLKDYLKQESGQWKKKTITEQIEYVSGIHNIGKELFDKQEGSGTGVKTMSKKLYVTDNKIESLKLQIHNHSKILEYLRRVTDPKKSLPMTSKEIYVVINDYLEDIKKSGGQDT